MSSKFQLVLATVALTLTLVLAMAPFDSNEQYDVIFDEGNEDSIVPLSFVDLGRAPSGKEYFAEINQAMNWVEAVAHCIINNYMLASIEDEDDLDYLNRNLTSRGHSRKWFWTSAQVSRAPEMFNWSGTNETIDGEMANLEFTFMEGVSYYCVSYITTGNTNGRLHGTLCSAEVLPLCQRR